MSVKDKTLVIDRSKWSRTIKRKINTKNYDDGNALLTLENRMCCLGFMCKFGGVKKMDMLDTSLPSSLPNSVFKKSVSSKNLNDLDIFEVECATENDDPTGTPKQQERKIAKMLVEYFGEIFGFTKVKFVGKTDMKQFHE